MKIEKFQDLEVWQISRGLVKYVYKLTYGDMFSKDFGLCDQIRRASVSIMANIAEGFGGTTKNFLRYLDCALRSTYEVQSHLYVALDLKYVKKSDFADMYEKINATIGMIKGLIKYLNSFSKKAGKSK
jgi:four helix bundle protein